ncbi:MAG: hypothetical protein KDE28_21405, partial [Anaerolineales bacterium]|nr:hypothetical protein [Anaerolineales bacterium]
MSYFDPPPDFQQAVTRALRAWRKVGSSESAILDGLYLFDRQQQSGKLDARLFTNQILQLGLDRLEEKLPDQAQILMLRFQDDEPREVAADKVGLSASGLDKVQRKALEALAGEIWQLELQALAERAHKLLLSLPQSGAQELFGVEVIVNDLLDLLQADDGPRTIILAGIGGIGKTSLALELVRQAAFDKRFQLFAFVPLPAASEAVISPDNLFDS